MGLRQRLVHYAVAAPHILLVEVPGWWTLRVDAERTIRSRGWRLATSPADADILAVCGIPGARLAEAVERTWEQLPGPRARVGPTGSDISEELDEAVCRLADQDAQAADAASRCEPTARDSEQHGMGHHDMGHGEMGHGEMGHGEVGHGDMGHGDMGHGDMSHGDMDMAPAGIPLAGVAEDRDGLEMDVLHVPLGPILPGWPAGLVLQCTLHGDLVATATVEILSSGGSFGGHPSTVDPQPTVDPEAGHVVSRSFEHGTRAAARTCDGIGQLLAVAGWDDGAAIARRIRDELLDSPDAARASQAVESLAGSASRSRVLRWALRGVGVVEPALLAKYTLPTGTRGDAYDRLFALLDRARAELRDSGESPWTSATVTADLVPTLVGGLELSAARLVVASLDLRVEEMDRMSVSA